MYARSKQFCFQRNEASEVRIRRSVNDPLEENPLHGNALFNGLKAVEHTREKRSNAEVDEEVRLDGINIVK